MELNQETLDAFKQYEELKIQEREIAEKLKELQPKILPFVPEDKELQGDKGYFYIQKRPSWSYTKEVDDLEASLKGLKKQQQADGTAKVEYFPTLYYKTGTPEEKEQG